MWYIALATVEQHVERVRRRAARGGHSASEATLRRIHAASLANLPAALDPERSGVGFIRIYDNSGFERRPDLVWNHAVGSADCRGRTQAVGRSQESSLQARQGGNEANQGNLGLCQARRSALEDRGEGGLPGRWLATCSAGRRTSRSPRAGGVSTSSTRFRTGSRVTRLLKAPVLDSGANGSHPLSAAISQSHKSLYVTSPEAGFLSLGPP
jgi:hypothetical protein